LRLFALAIATTLTLAQALPAARAQARAEPAVLVREALASAYGTAMVAELGKNLRAGGDQACLGSRAIAADQLEARGLALMTKWGTRMVETSVSHIDKNIFAEKFPHGAELAKLEADGTVKRYLAIAQPIRQTKLLDAMFEQFDRHVLITRIKLAPVSPLASGNAALLDKDPSDAAEAKLGKFIAGNKSAALKRYLALAEQEAAARTAATKKEPPAQPVATVFFGGLEADLEQLCISRR
jgi:hypothetical protein